MQLKLSTLLVSPLRCSKDFVSRTRRCRNLWPSFTQFQEERCYSCGKKFNASFAKCLIDELCHSFGKTCSYVKGTSCESTHTRNGPHTHTRTHTHTQTHTHKSTPFARARTRQSLCKVDHSKTVRVECSGMVMMSIYFVYRNTIGGGRERRGPGGSSFCQLA